MPKTAWNFPFSWTNQSKPVHLGQRGQRNNVVLEVFVEHVADERLADVLAHLLPELVDELVPGSLELPLQALKYAHATSFRLGRFRPHQHLPAYLKPWQLRLYPEPDSEFIRGKLFRALSVLRTAFYPVDSGFIRRRGLSGIQSYPSAVALAF